MPTGVDAERAERKKERLKANNRRWRKKRYATDPEYRARMLEYNRAQRTKNRELILSRDKRRRQDDPEYRARYLENAKRSRQRIGPELLRDRSRRTLYGLSPEAYKALLETQGGRCAICAEERALVVDHCHQTKKVRGLLCGNCNRGLGYFSDSPARLISAAAYLGDTSAD